MGKEIKLPPLCVAAFIAIFTASAASGATLVRFQPIPGDLTGPGGTDNWIKADSFSLSVNREFEPTPGTEDINIGVGELQECTISKSMDSASPFLAQYAINGNSLGMCEVCLTSEAKISSKSQCYAHYVMDRCFVRAMHVSPPEGADGGGDGVPVEEIAIYFNKIAYGFQSGSNNMSWDNVHNVQWPEGVDLLFNFDPAAP